LEARIIRYLVGGSRPRGLQYFGYLRAGQRHPRPSLFIAAVIAGSAVRHRPESLGRNCWSRPAPKPVRRMPVLKPNDVMTLEYRSDRLNLNTDDNLVITRVNCG
jgi:hypothetical protein